MSLSSLIDEPIFSILDHILVAGSFVILFLGLIGNTLNIVVFSTHQSFRHNQCVFYLIVESIVDCAQLLITFTSRIGILVSEYDPVQTSLVWCKIRSMIAQACTLTSMTIICFAVIDQYLSTNHHPHFRNIRSLETARILVAISLSIWLLHGIPFLVFFEIRSTLGCAVYQLQFSLYYKFFHLPVLIGLLPIILGSTFSILAYRNVRRIVRLQLGIVRRRLDRQLTAMVLARVIFLIVVTLPFVLYRIYSLITSSSSNNSFRREIEYLVSNLTILIFTMNFSSSFYVFIISSARFRRQVHYQICRKLPQKCFRTLPSRNQIIPLPTLSHRSR